MLREVEMNLQQQGLSFELYEQFTGKNKDAIKADLTDQAKDRVKLNLILAAIVEAENIEVTDEDIKNLCEQMKEVAIANSKSNLQRSAVKDVTKNVLLSWGILKRDE